MIQGRQTVLSDSRMEATCRETFHHFCCEHNLVSSLAGPFVSPPPSRVKPRVQPRTIRSFGDELFVLPSPAQALLVSRVKNNFNYQKTELAHKLAMMRRRRRGQKREGKREKKSTRRLFISFALAPLFQGSSSKPCTSRMRTARWIRPSARRRGIFRSIRAT